MEGTENKIIISLKYLQSSIRNGKNNTLYFSHLCKESNQIFTLFTGFLVVNVACKKCKICEENVT